MANPHRAAIYCRISRDDEGDALGVGRQEKDCRALAKDRGWNVARVYIDNDISAYSGKVRPEYQRLISDIRAGAIDAVIAWDPDRLHRSPREVEDFIDLIEKARIPVPTVQAGDYDLTTANGREMARHDGARARGESERMSARIRRKHRQLAEAGKSHGGGSRAFGYAPYDKERHRPGGIVPLEAQAIKDAVRRLRAGESLYSVMNDWNARQIKTAGGKVWDFTGLRQVLRSARISGRREHHGEIVKGVKAEWPEIIPPNVSDDLRRRLAPDRGKRATERSRFLLTPLVHCGRCGARLSASRIVDGENRPAGGGYTCARHARSRPDACGRLKIRSAFLDVYVTEALFDRLDTPELAQRVREQQKGVERQREALDGASEIEEDLKVLAKAFGEGHVGRVEWSEARKPLERRLAVATQRLNVEDGTAALDGLVGRSGVLRKAWGPPSPLGQLPEKTLKSLTAVEIAAYGRSLSLDRKRAILGLLVDRVIVKPADLSKSRNVFDPARVKVEWKF